MLTDAADDIVRVNLDGEKLEGRVSPPGERFIHTEIYKKFPHIKAVIHGHPTLPVAFSVAGQEILPVEHRAVIFYPAVKILDLPAQINTPELGQRVAEALGDNLALMLRHHGVVVVGQSIEAFVPMLSLCKECSYSISSVSLGKELHAVRPEGQRRIQEDLGIWPCEKTCGDEEE